jgi:tape measure domain-containing protein
MPVTLDTLLLEFAADFSQYDAAVNDAERRHMAAAQRLQNAYGAVKPPKLSDLKVNVDLSQLHELNRLYNVVKPADHKAFQRFLDANPLKVKTDTSQMTNAIALIKDLRGELTSLKSQASIQARLTVTHQIDGRQVGDQIRSASKDGAGEYEKAIAKAFRDNKPSGGGVLGNLLSIPGAVVQGIGIQVGDRISRGFGKATDSSLEAFGRGLDKQINRAVQTMTIGLARAGGYGSAKDFRKDAAQTLDNLTNLSPQRVNRAIRKLEDNLVDVLESAIVDGDQTAVAAKLKKLQTEMLERPIEAAMNTAGAALRIGAQPFRIRKRVELARTVQEAEGMVDEILQRMSDALKEEIKAARGVTIATGGIDYQKGGENTYFSANLVRKLTPGNVTIPVPNAYSNDPSTLGGLYQARQAIFPGAPMPVDRLLHTAVEAGRNPDAAKMLAQVMAVRKIAPDTPITLTGSSGGAALVEEVIGAAERAAIAKVKGVGLTLPGFDLTRTASKANYQTLVGSYDPVAIGAFGGRFNDQSRYFGKALGAAPFNATGLLSPGQATSVFPGLGMGHHLADFLADPKVQSKFTSFTGTGNIDPGYTGDRKAFEFSNKLYSESQAIPRTIGVILGDLKALAEVAKGEYSFIDPGHPDYRRDNDFAAMSGNFEKLKVTGPDAEEYQRFLAWLKTFKRELTSFYEMAGTHEGMMPKGLTDAARQGQEFFKFREGVSQPAYNAPLNIPNAPEKVYELATIGTNAVSSALEKLSPMGEAAASVLTNVAQGLGNIAGDRLQKRVDNLRGGTQGGKATAGELGAIAAQDIETTKQVALKATEQFVKFADGTIKAGKAARDFFQGLRSEGRTIQDLGDAVVEVSAELITEFETFGELGTKEIKQLAGSMAALKGEIDSLPPLLPAAGINESEKKTQELVQTAYSLYEVWDKLSKESQSISLAQGGVFDINQMHKFLDIVLEIENALVRSREVTKHTYDQGLGPLVAQVRSVQEPLGRLKGGAYRAIASNLGDVKAAAADGDNTAQGFIDGLKKALPIIREQGNRTAQAYLDALETILEIKSPSRRMIRDALFAIAGWVKGTAEGLPDIFKSGKSVGDTFTKAVEEASPAKKLGQNVRANIDAAAPGLRTAMSRIEDAIIGQLRFIAPQVTDFVEGLGFDLNKLKGLGKDALILGGVAVGVGLLGGKTVELFNATADAATEQNRFKRILDQTVNSGGDRYYAKLATEANKYGVNLALAAKSAASLETSLINKPLAGQGVEILSGFQAQFASQGTNTEDQGRALTGVEQAIRKGKLQAEELYQIIEPLPGSMEALAAATGKTTAELFRATSQGEVFTEDIIQKFSDQLKIQSGLSGGADTAEASMGRMQNQTELLMANMGQLTTTARKAGTDLFGGGLQLANENAGLLTDGVVVLTGAIGVGLISASIKAAASLAAMAAQTALGRVALGAFNSTVAITTRLILPLAAAMAAYEAIQFAIDLSKPTEEFEKLNDRVEKLLESTKKLNQQSGVKKATDIIIPENTKLRDLPAEEKNRRLARGPFDGIFKAIEERKQQNNIDSVNEDISYYEKINNSAKEFLKTLTGNTAELDKIKSLQSQIANLKGEQSVASNAGDTEKVTAINQQLVKLQAEFNKSIKGTNLNEYTGQLTQEIKLIDDEIAKLRSNDVLSPVQQSQLSQLEVAKSNAQGLYNSLQKVYGLSSNSLQSINASVETRILQADRLLEQKQLIDKRIQVGLINDFGGPGASDQQKLAIANAQQKVAQLGDVATQLNSYLDTYNAALKKIEPEQLAELNVALKSQGTTLDKATQKDLESALKILEGGDRKPSESLKNFVNKVAVSRAQTVTQLGQNAVEQAQAQKDLQKSQLDAHNAAIDYARTLRDGNYDLTKAIADHTRELKRAYEDTILETQKLQLEALNLSRNNNIRSRIQSTAGDFTDQLVGSIQQFLDQVNEAMSIKLEGAGARQGIDRKIQDLIRTEEEWGRGIAKQQEGLSDAVAAQQGVGKISITPSGLINPVVGTTSSNGGGYDADTGLDIITKEGSKIIAALAGKLIYAERGHVAQMGQDSSPATPGKQDQHSVLVELDKPFEYSGKLIRYMYYTHLRALEKSIANKGQDAGLPQRIEAGQLLGESGVANGTPHLHVGAVGDRQQSIFLNQSQLKELLYGSGGGLNLAQKIAQPQVLTDANLTKIDKFIQQYAPSSRLQGSDFAAASSASGVSIDALVTQALIESHFGTAGRAAYTKNPLNYGNDDESNDKYFGSFREGLIHAAKALQKDFFVSTPESFMNRGFKGRYGIYATDPQYLSKYKSALGLVRDAIGTPASGAGDGAGYTNPVVHQPDNSAIIGATAQQLEAQKVAQSQLERLKAQKSTLDADATGRGIIRTLKDQITAELQASNTAQSATQQRRDSILVQTPVTQVYGQLSQKTFADDSELIQKQRDLQKKQEDLAGNNRLVALLQDKLAAPNIPANFKASYTEIIKLTGERNAKLKELIPTLQEEIETIKDTSPLKTFARELRIAAETQISSAESVMSQLSQFNEQLQLPGSIDLAQTTRAISSQYRSLRESALQQNEAYTASIQKTLELEAAQRKLGNLHAADVLKSQAKQLAESALEFQAAANALTPAAEQVAIANAKLDALYKMRLDARKFVDALGAQGQTNLGLQAQLYEGAGDTYSANAIKRQVELMGKQKEISDKLLENENEIAKLRNKDSLTGDITSPLDPFGTLGAGAQIDALEQTNQKLREMMGLTEELAAKSFPTFSESMERTFAESGGGAVKEFFNSLNSGKGILESLGGAFTNMGNTIIQKVIEMVSQIVQSKLLDLIKGLFGGGLGNFGGFSGVTGVSFTSIPGFYSGGPVIGNLAGGGPVDLGLAALKALDKERQLNGGQGVGLYALTHGEQVLDQKDAAFYRAIEANGIWDDLKANTGYDSPIGNRANGGPVGDYASVVNNRSSANNQSSISIPMSFNVESKGDAEAVKAIAPELQKRMEYTFNELWLNQQRQRGAIS